MAPHLIVLAGIPLAGLLILLLLPSGRPRAYKLCAAASTAAAFVFSLALVAGFDRSRVGLQYVFERPWVPSLGAYFSLGVDGYALLLLALSTLLTLCATLASWSAIGTREREFYAWMLLLEAAVCGVFTAQDFLLFFVCWELVLIPMWFLIGLWGGPRASYAANKFLVYTVLGSVFMLLGGIALGVARYKAFGDYSWRLRDLATAPVAPDLQWLIFWAFFAGFAVKVPMWPFHTWLPDAHTEAPTAGSVLLAGVLLKMGTYGLLRFSLPLLPDAARRPEIALWLGGLSLVAIIYGALVCLMQTDWKKLIAYSSVSHLGFCTLGIFALNPIGLTASMLQQLNHGISTGMLFLLVGIAYERRHTREIAAFSGLIRTMPVFSAMFAVAAFSSMGMPPLNGFIGELGILQGAARQSTSWAYWCALGILLGVAYMLWLLQRIILGDAHNESGLRDLNAREKLTLAPLVLLMFWIGVYPQPFLDYLEPSATAIAERVQSRPATPAAQR